MYLHRFSLPVLRVQMANGVKSSAAAVLINKQTGMTPGRRIVLKEKPPSTEAAKISPKVTEKDQLMDAATRTLLSNFILLTVFPSGQSSTVCNNRRVLHRAPHFQLMCNI